MTDHKWCVLNELFYRHPVSGVATFLALLALGLSLGSLVGFLLQLLAVGLASAVVVVGFVGAVMPLGDCDRVIELGDGDD